MTLYVTAVLEYIAADILKVKVGLLMEWLLEWPDICV